MAARLELNAHFRTKKTLAVMLVNYVLTIRAASENLGRGSMQTRSDAAQIQHSTEKLNDFSIWVDTIQEGPAKRELSHAKLDGSRRPKLK